MAGLFDVAAERTRLVEEREKVRAELEGLGKRLENPQFVERAKPEVVAEARRSRPSCTARRRRSRACCARWEAREPRPRARAAGRPGALEEDLGARDVTSEATVPENARARGVLLAKQELVVAGLDVAVAVFQALDPACAWEPEARRATASSRAP